MIIFIGSSKEKKAMAKKIAIGLRKDGHTVKLWWDDGVFIDGDYTLLKLIHISNWCDGAVFVFGKDDTEIWFRDKENNTKNENGTGQIRDIPRDNVILEYGIFVSKLGTERVSIVTEKGVKLPSDLSGITYTNKSYVK